MNADGVTVSGGERIPAATVVWAGGVEAPGWTQGLGLALEQGRILVDRNLRVPGHPEVFVVGDLAAISDRRGHSYPQLAPGGR